MYSVYSVFSVVLCGPGLGSVVVTPEGICKDGPACALLLPPGFVDDGGKFEMAFSATWYTVGKCLLHSCIRVLVGQHER